MLSVLCWKKNNLSRSKRGSLSSHELKQTLYIQIFLLTFVNLKSLDEY